MTGPRTLPLAALVALAISFAWTPAFADLGFSAPASVATLDMGKLKGTPYRLAWSPDAKQVYVQTAENPGRPNAKYRHYVFALADGAKQDLQAEPEWANAYWVDKSAQTSPDDLKFRIEPKTEQRTQRGVSAPMGGEMARGGTSTEMGTSTSDGVSAAYNSQSSTVTMLLLNGENIGEFVNAPLVPGLTFGWGPKGTKRIAYAAPKDGQVIVMDRAGTKTEVAGSRDALLPAWSPDGSRLAWLQKDGRRSYRLQVVDVTKS